MKKGEEKKKSWWWGRGQEGKERRAEEEGRGKGEFSFQLVVYAFSPGFVEILKIALKPTFASPHAHPTLTPEVVRG